MLQDKQTKTDLGKIKIHADALSSIATIAALEIKGVSRTKAGLFGKACEFFGKSPDYAAVRVNLRESNELDIGISIAVEYGYDVPRVANLVQENIRRAIEKMTGLVPVNVDVKVKGIDKK